jgi:hypothetical protein
MSACPSREDLDEVALGGGTAAAREHAESCPQCSKRLEWLRKEEDLVRRWAAQDQAGTGHLWEGIQGRIAAGRRRRWLALSACAAAAAAAGLWFARMPGLPFDEPEGTASASAAIDRAEAEYGRAIDQLEAQVSADRRDGAGSPKRGAALAQARNSLARARASSGRDAAGRVRLLEGYAAYLRSLRRALREAE